MGGKGGEERRREGRAGEGKFAPAPPPKYIFGLTPLGMDKAKHNASVAAQAAEGGIKAINHVDYFQMVTVTVLRFLYI